MDQVCCVCGEALDGENVSGAGSAAEFSFGLVNRSQPSKNAPTGSS